MTKMMNIGIDASRIAFKERTGTENYSLKIVEGLSKIDKKNRYTLYFNQLPSYFEISQTNVSSRFIPAPRLWTQVRLAAECLIRSPDVLFVPAHTIPVIRWPKLKTVVTLHDLGAKYLANYHKFPQKYYLNWSTEYVAKHASAIIAVSEATKRDLVKMMKVDPKRVFVVHEGVDHDIFRLIPTELVDQVRKRYGLVDPYFLYVGTIQPRKNLERLIEAFAKLKNKKISLVLVGKPGWLYKDIYEAPKRLSVEERVKFLGYVNEEDLVSLYNGTQALVYPSLAEGFGLPILEAMACGAPVLTSNTSSMPEISGQNALLVNAESTEEIARNLALLLSNQTLRKKLSREGLDWVKNFTWERTAKETLKVLEQVYEKD